MSFSGLATPQGRRNTILASVAVAALGVAGVLGGNAFSPDPSRLCGGRLHRRPAPERPVVRAADRSRQSLGRVGQGQDRR